MAVGVSVLVKTADTRLTRLQVYEPLCYTPADLPRTLAFHVLTELHAPQNE